MAPIKGSEKIIAMGLASTFATPVALGTGNRIEVESYTDSENTTELTLNPIGGGVVMESDSERGTVSPTIDVEAVVGYDNALLEGLAQFCGDVTISTIPSGAYEHKFFISNTFNTEWITIADQKTSTDTAEYPSCAVTSISFNATPNDYMRMSMSLLANLQDIDQSNVTNDLAQLQTTTVANTRRVVVRPENLFRINAQGGAALSGSDNMAISSATIAFDKPQEHVDEIRGQAGNGEPESTDGIPLAVTLTITRKNLPDLDFFDAHQDGTEYKALLAIDGPVISGAIKYQFYLYFPRLKIVVPPDAPSTSPGRNPETITLKALVASAAPSGMLDEYPYIVVRNTRSTAYEA